MNVKTWPEDESKKSPEAAQKTPDDCKDKIEFLCSILKNIILSCVHPDVAYRATFVDLKPIRKALKQMGITDPNLGIHK